MTKAIFMEKLKEAGFEPLNEDGVIMIRTDDKEDLDKMDEIADACGFTNRGSYGWGCRKVKSEDKPPLPPICKSCPDRGLGCYTECTHGYPEYKQWRDAVNKKWKEMSS